MRQLQKFMKCNRTLCQEGLGHPCCTSRAEQTFCYNTVTLKWSLLISAVLMKVLRQAAEVLYMSLRRPRFTSLNCDLSSAGIKRAAEIHLAGQRSSGAVPRCAGRFSALAAGQVCCAPTRSLAAADLLKSARPRWAGVTKG